MSYEKWMKIFSTYLFTVEKKKIFINVPTEDNHNQMFCVDQKLDQTSEISKYKFQNL